MDLRILCSLLTTDLHDVWKLRTVGDAEFPRTTTTTKSWEATKDLESILVTSHNSDRQTERGEKNPDNCISLVWVYELQI